MNRFKLTGVFVLFALSSFVLTFCTAEVEEYEDKTLSQIMRERVDDLRIAREAIINGEEFELTAFNSFSEGTPSRENLLTERQWEELASFDMLYGVLMKQASAESYNSVVQTCLSCHERTCPGPVRLIQRLAIDEDEMVSTL